jgi:hypothetical protein
MHGTLGLKGWQWIFVLEGLPTCIIGVATWFTLTDSPAAATWVEALPVNGGMVTVPERPGHGLAFEPEVLAKFQRWETLIRSP